MIKKSTVIAIFVTALVVWVIARWIPSSGGYEGTYTFKA